MRKGFKKPCSCRVRLIVSGMKIVAYKLKLANMPNKVNKRKN